MDNKKQINDIVAMLDNFVTNGGGHMNINVNDASVTDEVIVETFKSQDCATGNMACKVPTLQDSIDSE